MQKRAQLQLSFGVIFSIIIIVATLAVAGYIIVKFLNTDSNVQCKLFVQDLQTKINSAWASDGASSYVFTEDVPSGVQQVCLGYLNASASSQADQSVQTGLHNYAPLRNNFFFYPRSSCGGSFYNVLQHTDINGFFCFPTQNGKASITVSKGSFDALVKLGK